MNRILTWPRINHWNDVVLRVFAQAEPTAEARPTS